jgi:hypothetical protein
MYRVNQVGRPVLITVSEVIAKAAVDQSADIRYLLNSIEVAEERYIAPALGDALYEDLVNSKNVLVTDGNQPGLQELINESRTAAGKNPIELSDLRPGMYVNAIELVSSVYQELWNRYLWKITAEAVDLCATVPTWLRTTAQGQQLNAPQTIGGITEGSASGDRKDVQFKMDSMAQNRLLPLIERMKLWLCRHEAWYPLFENCGCYKADGLSNAKGGIILGIYDQDERPREVRPAPVAKAAPRQRECSLKIVIAKEPDDSLFMLCNLKTIKKQYPAGDTLTIPHLIGKEIEWPMYIDSAVYMDMPYDKETGTLDNTEGGGFVAPAKVLIKYIETL